VSTALVLPHDPSSPGLARRFVEEYAAERGLDAAADALCIIATELVTNAIVHGAAPVTLTLHHQNGAVTIEVTDGDPATILVTPRQPDHTGPGGRGLRIVASLADGWGTRSTRSGKSVWATSQTHA
jgi:anti-sigma regulatory factor (Ser/Thr protein kinase)